MTLAAALVLAYFAVVVGVGVFGHRLFRGTGEDYFVASRSIGPVILLLTLFGTHMTAFTLLGASDEAYRSGVSVFALMASSSGIQIPFLFHFVGARFWRLGKRHGYLTQIQFIRDRYESAGLGLLLFAVLILLLLPYVLIGVIGAGEALSLVSGAPAWVGGLVVCGVVFGYVAHGGMRSTSWVNAFQTGVFMFAGGAAFWVIAGEHGGLTEAMTRLRAEHPELMALGSTPQDVARSLSFLLLPCAAGTFPHIFGHWLTARNEAAFRLPVLFYPVCIAAVWLPSVVLGLIGRLDFPAPPPGPVLTALISEHAGGVLAGLLVAGLSAAIMSSLDSQALAAGTMFTQDIVRHYGFHDRLGERSQVLIARAFLLALLAAAFLLAQVAGKSIFALGVWSLSGFSSLLPMFLAALYWRRSTAAGAAASIVTAAGLWLYFYVDSLGHQGPYSVGETGLLPVAVIVPAAAAALVAVSLMTRQPSEERLARFFD